MSLMSEEGSQDTDPTTISIAPLQDMDTVEGKQGYNLVNIDDPRSFDLVEPSSNDQEQTYSLEHRADLLFSKKHLEIIFNDARLFLKFTTFLSKHRPQSVPLLIYYLDSLKALKAIAYSNAIVDSLESTSVADFTMTPPKISSNASLQEKSDRAFAFLAQEDLPAYITHVFVDIVSSSIHRKITGTMAPQLLQASEGLAEVFCMSDMSKPDNPIVFSSEEFHRTTQYGLNYALGRNCRFLQGPRTTPSAVRRLREAVRNGREHQETFLNYRRDGSPFMNLLTMAPLLDNQGKVRYYIGAQVDVSGLVKDCTNLEALARLVTEHESRVDGHEALLKEKKDEFQSLSEMFNQSELETVRLHGGRMHSEQHELDDNTSVRVSNRPRLLIREPSEEEAFETRFEDDFIPQQGSASSSSPAPTPVVGRLPGVFSHYLIIRPYPSLRITFTSPTLRVPGLLQSPFLSRIGGSPRVREELTLALSEGRNVTAKIRWLNVRFDETADGNMDDYHNMSQAGKARWIHCTPLLGPNRAVGAWMVIMIDGEDFEQTRAVQAERIGVVSPSWGRGSQINGHATAPRTRPLTGRPAQYLRDPSPVARRPPTENSEWDLDLDIATASVQQHPSFSNQAVLGSTNRITKPRSQVSAFMSGPSSPPPPQSVPPPPVSNYVLPRNNSGISDISRTYTGKYSTRSNAVPAIPQSTYQNHDDTSTAPSYQSATGQPSNGYTEHVPQIPPVPSSDPTVHSFTLAPLVGSVSTSSSSSNQPANTQPIIQPPKQSQHQAHPPPPAIPITTTSPSPRDFQPPPRLHAKQNAATVSKKPHASFGHRVFQGFRKAGTDKEKDNGTANKTSVHVTPPGQPMVISAPVLQGVQPGLIGKRVNQIENGNPGPSTSHQTQQRQQQSTVTTGSGASFHGITDDRYTLG